MNQTNFAALTKAGHATRFGPDWPGQRCLAKTRQGTPCQNPAIRGRGRCKLHGGRSAGPRTPEGKARSIACAHEARTTVQAHVKKVRAINAEIKQITLALKREGLIP